MCECVYVCLCVQCSHTVGLLSLAVWVAPVVGVSRSLPSYGEQ